MGPLLYHFAEMYGQEDVSFSFAKDYIPSHAVVSNILSKCFCFGQEMSIELSLEDVKKVALHYGFQFEVNLITYVIHSFLISASEPQQIYTFNLFLAAEGKYHRDNLHDKSEINDASKLQISIIFH